MEGSGATFDGCGGTVSKLVRRTRSGARVWSDEVKGRAVFESMKPGARVCEVAQRFGVKPQQITTWRRLARKGELTLATDEASDFVTIEVREPVASREATPIEISFGRVSVRLDADAAAARIAEIAIALERSA